MFRSINLNELAERQQRWSEKTFGGMSVRNPVGPAEHLINEIRFELIEPFMATKTEFDSGELADCLILLLDMIWRSGFAIDEIISLAGSKMDANEHRSWPANNGQTPTEHDRTKPVPPEEVLFHNLAGILNERAKRRLIENIVPYDIIERLGLKTFNETMPVLIGQERQTGAGVFANVVVDDQMPDDVIGVMDSAGIVHFAKVKPPHDQPPNPVKVDPDYLAYGNED